VAIEKRGDLRSGITLLQYSVADESIAAVHYGPLAALPE
jgi:hypothetical protein